MSANTSALGRVARARTLLILAVASFATTGCDWFTDFKRQPDLATWEPDSLIGVRGQPSTSVPTTGMAVPGYAVSYAQFPATIDSMAGLANPVPMTDSSLATGRQYFQINCSVCHGDKGDGQGPAVAYGMVPISLLSDVTVQRTDGYLFGMIRNGRGLMPSYNRIPNDKRWDVVNYVRALQGRGPAGVTVATGPLAPPGVTGSMLPGVTSLGPTRHVPPVLPELSPTAGPPVARTPKSQIGIPGSSRSTDTTAAPGAAGSTKHGGAL